MGELKSCPFCGGENIVIIPCYEENCENECCDGCDDVKYTAVCRKSKNGCGASCGWYKTKEQAIEHWNTHRRKRGDGVSKINFDYGIVVYKHRFNLSRSLDDYEETTLNKCICMGVELKYKTMACDKLIYEMQVVYKDENGKLQCLCLDLHDWTITVKHIGNMQCNI